MKGECITVYGDLPANHHTLHLLMSFNPYDPAMQLGGIGFIPMKEGTERISKPEI